MSLRLRDLLPALTQDSLRIFVHPQSVVLVRFKRNTKQVVARQHLVCGSPAADAPVWGPALDALAGALQHSRWQGARPQLALSSHLVRYALIPWHASLGRPSERQALLRHHFQLAYGEAARDWDLRMSDNGYQRAALASGVAQALLQDIQRTLDQAGFKPGAIYPHLMLAANQARQQVRDEAYWLALVEQGRLCIALLDRGSWISVKSVALQQHETQQEVATQLSTYIERESILCGVDTAAWPIHLYWPGQAAVVPMQAGSRSVHWLRPHPHGRGVGAIPPGIPSRQQPGPFEAASDYEAVMWA